MYILDTDHLSLIRRNGAEGKRILTKLSTVANSDLATTIVTYEEKTKGRFAVLSQAKTLDEVVLAYNGLQQLVLDYQSIAIVAFDYNAALEHQRLRKQYPRLGNMDLKIAAITLTQQATLLTRNLSDFGQIGGLSRENWADP